MSDKHIATCVVVLSADRKHFLAGERINGFCAGYYGLPGGRLDLGEKVEDGAFRELFEEVGIVPTDAEFLGAVREFRRGEYTFTHYVYVCLAYTGDVRNMEPDKCAGWEWQSFIDLRDRLMPGHEAAIDIYLHPESRLRDIVSELD